MKFEIKLGNVKIEELGVEFGGVELKAEYTLEETKGAYSLIRQAIKEVPEMLEDIKAGALKFREIDKEIEEIFEEDIKKKREKYAKLLEEKKNEIINSIEE